MLRKKHLLFFVVLTVVTNSCLQPLFAPSPDDETSAPCPQTAAQQTSIPQTPSEAPANTLPVACAAPHTQPFASILLHTKLQGTNDLAPKKAIFPLFRLPDDLWKLILDFAYEDAFDEGTVTDEWKNLRLTCKTINQYVTNEAFFQCAHSYLSDINYITRFVTPCPLKALVDVFLTNVTMDIPEILLNPDPRTLTKQGTFRPGVGWSSVPYTEKDIEAVATLKSKMHARPEQFTLNVLNPTDKDIAGLSSVPCPLDVSFQFGEMPNFALLSTLKSLKKLILENRDVITSLGDLSSFTALEVLRLRVPEATLAFPAHPFLALQDLGQANMPAPPQPAAQTLEAMGIPPNLQTIVVDNCQGLTDISHLLKLPKLQNIFIHDCPLVPPAQVAALKAHIDARDAMTNNS